MQIVVLRMLRSRLAEGLADIEQEATYLYLRPRREQAVEAVGDSGDNAQDAADAADDSPSSEELFQAAQEAILHVTNTCTKVCKGCCIEQLRVCMGVARKRLCMWPTPV